MRKKIFAVIFLAAGSALLAGCGNVGGPFSPLINPPLNQTFGTFDNNSIDGWTFDSVSPPMLGSASVTFPGSAVTLLSPTAQPVFQGSYALQIPIPADGQAVTLDSLSNPVTVSVPLTSYSIHYQFASPQDMTNKTFSMWVYLKSGLVDSPNRVGAQIFVKGGPETISGVAYDYQYANGTFWNLTEGQWTQVIYNIMPQITRLPHRRIRSRILQVGLQISGAGSVSFTSNGVVVADSFGY